MNRNTKILLTVSAALLFAASLAFFLYLLFDEVRNADSPPVISLTSDEIHVGVNASREELLIGVSAMDAEDGDLTDRVLIESKSQFVDKGKSIITYAVFDSANHAATASRTLYFTDYTSPRFEIKDRLEFSYTSAINPLGFIRAYDCIDGDISGKVSMTLVDSNDFLTSIGTHLVEFRVINSFGDAASFQTEIVVNDRTNTEQRMTPSITLSDYLVYIERGDLITPLDYLKGITVYGQSYTPEQYGYENIQVDVSGFDPTVTGLQKIVFYTEYETYIGSADLLVYVLDDNA